jgi:hypothetical protein
MRNWNRLTAAVILGASAFITPPLGADEAPPGAAPAAQAPAEPTPTPVKTGKERLSSKASDEQRVDNCKVPPELRGTTVRPDTCEGESQKLPTD